MSFTTTTFWRKTYSVDAVRLTLDNYKQVADYLGWEYHETADREPYIEDGPSAPEAGIGDWLVKGGAGEEFVIYDHDDFLEAFRTHSEQISEDEKYAKVYELVAKAMRKQDAATYNGDSSGMDLVAIETTKKILNEL